MSEQTTGPCGYLPGDADEHTAHCADARYWKKRALVIEAEARLEEHKAYCWTCLHQSEEYKRRGVGNCPRAATLTAQAQKGT